MRTALVLGAGGFIGSHMVKRLKLEGYWVRGVDLKEPEFSTTHADEFVIGDLRLKSFVGRCLEFKGEQGNFYSPVPSQHINRFDEIYQFAADMGGAGFVFTGENDADIMYNSATINLNVLNSATTEKIFYSSSACIYPEELQKGYNITALKESDAYPGNPDSEYGWEKLFSERLYLAYARNKGIDIRIARFHNIFGIEGTYEGGKEKAPAAICRKVALAAQFKSLQGGYPQIHPPIEIWGAGLQTRSFLYIDECIEGVWRLMESNYKEPLNIGSDEVISINDLAKMVIELSGKMLEIKNIEGPTGVMGRNSDNDLIEDVLNWSPSKSLKEGIEKTYKWIASEINK